ncbi:UDP-GalNAc:beta-1,3-N-acetylgalactosaminyltransferase 2-like [Acanthaster planci]|uniref:Hexosyltransferase n=1 Tax=Acanthaster planci TaxID=133434 RepID=A0A8B7Y9A3_ACAPL|nr:UDP-GalNAc:beta-1,3-N-acetylgalactosaminyltransferase 2-like [Acanthaster planci]
MADRPISTHSAICFLSVWIVAFTFRHLFLQFGEQETRYNMHHEIVFGVLSARENSAQRHAVRETWGQYIREQSELKNKVLLRFIVGSRGCDIPQQFREDMYSCQSVLLNTSMVNLNAEIVALDFKMPLSNRYGATKSLEYFGTDFKVNYALIVRKLGINAAALSQEKQCSVTLYDTWSQEPVIDVTFTPNDPGTLLDGFRFKDVETYLFPKNFEGTIVVGPLSKDDVWLSERKNEQIGSHMHNTHKILSARKILRTSKTKGFPSEIELLDFSFPLGNFVFEIYEPVKVDEMIKYSSAMAQSQIERNNQESQTLKDEQKEYSDLLFVDEIDVYRNIPQKLVHFFRWVINSTEANFIIKTDDDCFMNVEAVIRMLQNGHITAKSRTWWGNFRTNWPLDVLGKWAETEYPAPVYPAFACGSGNLLTRDLVEWIAQNSQFLHVYQGEDVSMGIWLASILPYYIDDSRWKCDDVCQQDVFVLPELSPQQLRTSWKNWMQCQNPCSCG